MTLFSTFSFRRSEVVRRVGKTSHIHKREFPKYQKRYEDGKESIWKIAQDIGYPAYLLARLFIEVSIKPYVVQM